MADYAIVHTSGVGFIDDDGRFAIGKLLDMTDLVAGEAGIHTRVVEAAFKIPRSVYFFVGHASAHFGNVVFVFPSVVLDARQSDVSPFDSGGLYYNHFPPEEPDSKFEYFQRHLYRTLEGTWRRNFKEFVQKHFRGFFADYALGHKPSNPGTIARLSAHDRRAWTWEVRLHEAMPVREAIAVRMSTDVIAALRVELMLRREVDHSWLLRLREAVEWWRMRVPDTQLHVAVELEVAAWGSR